MHVVPHREGPPEPHGLDHVTLQQPEQLGPGVGRLGGRGVHGRALYRRPISLLAEVIGTPSDQDCVLRTDSHPHDPIGADRRDASPRRGPAPRHLPNVDACSCGSSSRAWRPASPPSPSPARPSGRPLRSAPRGPGCAPRWIVRPPAGSRQASDGRFHNTLPDEVVTQGSLLAVARAMLFRGPVGRPRGPVPLAADPAPAGARSAGADLVRPLVGAAGGRRPARARRPGVGRARLAVAGDRSAPAAPGTGAAGRPPARRRRRDLPRPLRPPRPAHRARPAARTDRAVRRPARPRQPPAALGSPRRRGSSSWTGTSRTRSAA